MQHVLLKPNVKGVENDEDLPEDPVYVNFLVLYSCGIIKTLFFEVIAKLIISMKHIKNA